MRDKAEKRVDVEVWRAQRRELGSPGDLQFRLRNPFQDQVSPGQDGPGAQREGAIEDGGGTAEEGSEEPKSPGESPLPFLNSSCSSWGQTGKTTGWGDHFRALEGAGGTSGMG